MALLLLTTLLLPCLTAGNPIMVPRATSHNDFSCRSTTHPNPVVLFHGLGATYYEDLNLLESYLQTNDFCTFSITYGAYPEFPFVGGLQPIDESAAQLADFIQEVQTNTGASKVDLVGHSEGAFQSLYVPKFEGVAGIVDKVFAIAPPTHGTSFANLYTLTYAGGNLTNALAQVILDTVGCDACTDLVDNGAAVQRLNDGPIAQAGVDYTILISRADELVTPPYKAFVNETGVRNIYVQDYCPDDPVGHIGEAYDQNVWTLVLNTLSGSTAGPAPGACVLGSPGR
jgi:pimeloyl-ACP methyl ester carboxylesterase